jgi:hypothetical protein
MPPRGGELKGIHPDVQGSWLRISSAAMFPYVYQTKHKPDAAL